MVHAFPSLPPSIQVETITPAALPPWDNFVLPAVAIATSKDVAIEDHKLFVDTVAKGELLVYCDGSLMEGRGGSGVAMREGGEGGDWWEKAVALGKGKTVYLGEVISINTGLQLVLDFALLTDSTPTAATFFVDNQAALRSLCSGNTLQVNHPDSTHDSLSKRFAPRYPTSRSRFDGSRVMLTSKETRGQTQKPSWERRRRSRTAWWTSRRGYVRSVRWSRVATRW